MRQWNIPTNMMCDQHLLGEHVEHHMFIGCIRKGISLRGYINSGLVEVHNLRKRHDEIVVEMKRRGMRHYSPLPTDVELFNAGRVNVRDNIDELYKRCQKCRAKQLLYDPEVYK